MTTCETTISPERAAVKPEARDEKNPATKLIALVDELEPEFFHNPAGTSFVSFKNGGRRETRLIDSAAFRDWLAGKSYRSGQGAVGQTVIETAVRTMAGRAKYDGEECPVFVRVAKHDGHIYLDLGTDDWSVVKIGPSAGPEGWKEEPESPVRFVRPSGLLALPKPEHGGTVDVLRPLLNHQIDDDSWRLVVGFLLGVLNPNIPYPVLVLTGGQGAGKSVGTELLRATIDPNVTLHRPLPTEADPLYLYAYNSWMMTFNNVSFIPHAISDTLCCVSSGTGYAKREHYKNTDEVQFEARRPIVLNGIAPEMIERPDLQDRSLVVQLPKIAEGGRRQEWEIKADFEAALPKIFGALCRAAAAGLKNLPKVDTSSLPRLADFAAWVEACGHWGLGWSKGSFLAAFKACRRDLHGQSLNTWSVFPNLRRLAEIRWEGTVSQLLDKMNSITGRDHPTDWPKTSRKLGQDLRRFEADLEGIGIGINWPGRNRAGIRIILFTTADYVKE